jgi:hypothetical protein
VREFATESGFVVHEVRDAEQVLASVNRTLPAGIFMDVASADGSLDLIRNLKSDAFSANVPVVMHVPPDRSDLILAGGKTGKVVIAVDVRVGDPGPLQGRRRDRHGRARKRRALEHDRSRQGALRLGEHRTGNQQQCRHCYETAFEKLHSSSSL